MINCAFVTFVYPGVEKYLPKFVDSLNNQYDKEFVLIVHNDGVVEVNNYFVNCFFPVRVLTSGLNNLLEIRLWTFNYCKQNGFTHLILGDSDDYFQVNRISLCKKLLKINSIVVNDISLVNNFVSVFEERVFSRRIEGQTNINFESIRDFNFIGFTNSAFSIEVIKDFPKVVLSSKVVDWFFFSVLLLNGNSSFFTSETVSFYRQHENNIAGLRPCEIELNDDIKIYVENIRKSHFESLEKLFSNIQKSKDRNYESKNNNISFWWEI